MDVRVTRNYSKIYLHIVYFISFPNANQNLSLSHVNYILTVT